MQSPFTAELRVAPFAALTLAGALKIVAVTTAGLLVVLARTDDRPEVLRVAAEATVLMGVVLGASLTVFTLRWLSRRPPRPLPPYARITSFAESLRPGAVDLALAGAVAVGVPFLFPADEAASLLGIGLGVATSLSPQLAIIRIRERRDGVVLLIDSARSWSFRAAYSQRR